MRDLIHKITQFFRGEDFGENGEDARLELTPDELRTITYLMTENARLKTELDKHLDKIRAEIEELKPNNPNFKGYFEQNVALNKVLDIIDTYKTKRSDKE